MQKNNKHPIGGGNNTVNSNVYNKFLKYSLIALMVGISANSVEAGPRNRRSMSVSSSSTPTAISLKETLVNDSYKLTNREFSNLKNNIFNKKAILYKGIDNDYLKLFNKETRTYFFSNQTAFLTCFMKNDNLDFEVKGNYLLNHSNDRYSCYDNIEAIYIPDTNVETSLQVYVYELNNGSDVMGEEMDFANFEIAKISSLIPTDKFQKVKETCNFKSYYNDIKNLLTASTVASGVATAVGATGTALSVVDTIKDKKEGDTDNKLSGMNIADIALSGTSAATSMTSAIMNFVSVEKINKLSSQMDKCVDNARNLRNEIFKFQEDEGILNSTEINRYNDATLECIELSTLDKIIKDVKSLATASGVSGMIGVAANGASIATTVIGNTSDKVDGEKMNIASSVTSGIGTASALGGTVMNAKNLSKVQELINRLERCTEAIDEIK
ncbi:hypothetical protein HDR60_04320 [bacterium]|nr:hypothetical protein [bacterium]